MEKKFVLTESQLRDLLVAEMEMAMNEQDGVDNWEWYGESYAEIKREFCPDADKQELAWMSFEDIAQKRIDAGEFQKL